MNIPKLLESIRLHKKMTWAEMASALDISQSLIYQVKRGDRHLGDVSMRKLEELAGETFPEPDSARLEMVKIREALGFTQQQMSDGIGINRSYLSELESGKRPLAGWIIEKARQLKSLPKIEQGNNVTITLRLATGLKHSFQVRADGGIELKVWN